MNEADVKRNFAAMRAALGKERGLPADEVATIEAALNLLMSALLILARIGVSLEAMVGQAVQKGD